ncbi:valine--tRNA ligase [Candidatus Woesearchaeota archaeon]|nr:valine--tRNA ligase [Candidatus Woesearchaeota archaeon]
MEPKLKDKRWKKEFEKPIYDKWKNEGAYKFTKSDKPTYSIDTPPPYVNTPIHIGQATTYVLMDMFARFKRMKGYNVLFPLGLDRNGLPIEMAAEKKFKISLCDMKREEFLEKCNLVLQEASAASTESFLRLGISFNSWEKGAGIGDVYHTDSPEYRALTQGTFIDLYNKGLIYEDERINNYCPGCRTTIADAEIEYAEIQSDFNEVIFTVKDTGEKIIIGTTRPELICSCGMVIFHPDDERYQHLDGKTALTPIYDKEVPIKAHPMASIEKGTGLVMMCSAGDTSDVRFFRDMNLELLISINQDGTMNENAGFLKGLKVKEARKKMIGELKEKKLLVKQTQTVHRTPLCERSKDQIEFISMKEYYLKQIDFKDQLLEIADALNFYASSSRQILIDWINSITIDWPISRRRYYATEVPLWYCKSCGEVIVPPKGRYYQPWKEKPPIQKCKCGSTEFRGDERVLDTWFDSSNTPLYILGYGRDEEFFKNAFPCTVRPQGKEIIRTWLYYTLLKAFLLTGKRAFKDVWVNYHIVDEKGYKMSKSKGNVIDPKEILDRFGAEPFRLWCAVEGNLDRTDFKCSFERIEGAGKTLVKLWNVARFVSMFPEPEGKIELTELDKLILSEMSNIVRYAKARYEKYDFHNPAIRIKHFIWETFASHYLELVKNRAYNENGDFSKEEQNGALYALHKCLDTLLILLSPVVPMITSSIYSALRGRDVHSEGFPKEEKEESAISITELTETNSALWKAKKDASLSLKAEIKKAVLPEGLKPAEGDIKLTHNIKSLEYGKALKIEL